MNAEFIEPNLLAAQALKIAILRGEHCTADLHSDDSDFGEAALVFVLARLNTKEARQALVELFDFSLSDSVFNAIGSVVHDFKQDLMPVMRSRMGQPLSPQAVRSSSYGRGVLTMAQRDGLLQSWLSDMENDS